MAMTDGPFYECPDCGKDIADPTQPHAAGCACDDPVTDHTCGREIERRIGDLVDLLAAFPAAKIDPRAWSQLSVYVPRVKKLEAAINRYLADDFSCNGGAEQLFNEAIAHD